MDLKSRMLTPSLRKLIEVCHMLETTNTKVIANHLNRSPATIRTEFQRILQIMNVHSRFAAVKIAQNNGWLNTRAIYRRRHDDSRDNGLAEHSKKFIEKDMMMVQMEVKLEALKQFTCVNPERVL